MLKLSFRCHLVGIYPSTGQLYNEHSFLSLERRQPFTMRVVASDRGDPKRSATVNVQINIADVNDNAPKFTETYFRLTVQENSLTGKLVSTTK